MKTALRLLGVLSLATLTFVGCHELGHVDGLGDYGGFGSSDVVGEVDYVDTRAREIEVRTDSGRTSVVRYDDKTQVVYRQRNYSVADLERGDYIAAQTQQDRDGRIYTDSITVRESVQDRGDQRGGNRLDHTEGRVEYVDQPVLRPPRARRDEKRSELLVGNIAPGLVTLDNVGIGIDGRHDCPPLRAPERANFCRKVTPFKIDRQIE